MDGVLKEIEIGDYFSALKTPINYLGESGVIDTAVLFYRNLNDSEILFCNKEVKFDKLKIPEALFEYSIKRRKAIFQTIPSPQNPGKAISIFIHPTFINNSLSGLLYTERKRERRRFSEGEMNILRLTGEIASIYFIKRDEKKILKDMMEKGWVGSSDFSRNLRAEIERLSKLQKLLIEGETGFGKTLLAELIHRTSERKGEFVVVSCPSIPDKLFESELFGHRRGAFTGAINERKGLIGEADGGSLFLDEVSDIPLFLQGKLLRFLESGLYRRVGGDKDRESRCGVKFSTNRELEKEVEAGRFREDLYFRVSVHRIKIPTIEGKKGGHRRYCKVFLYEKWIFNI